MLEGSKRMKWSCCLAVTFLLCSFLAGMPVAFGQSRGTVEGRVKNLRSGIGVANAYVECIGPSLQSTYADADGNYTLTDLAPGPYTIMVSAVGYARKSYSLFVSPTVVRTPDFLLNLLSIKGRVYNATASNVGITEANVTIGEQFRLTNSTGHYEWLDLSDGTYTMTFSAPGYTSQSQQIIVSTGATAVADCGLGTVQPGRISGTVTDSRDPLSQVTVRVRRGSWTRSSITNEDGQYALEEIPTWPSWTVDAYRVGYVAQTTTASVQSGATTTLDFALVQFGRITGTVKDQATNQPIEGAVVKANSEFLNTTNSYGYYTMFVLAGTYTVTASAPGYASSSQSNIKVTEGGTRTVAFLLQSISPGNIVGSVTDATTGSPIVGAVVTADGGHSNITDSNGHYILSNLPCWIYTVSVSASGYISDSTQRNVPSGSSITADFPLSPFTKVHLRPYLNFGEPNYSFDVYLDIAEARFVYAWEVYLWWNPAFLDATAVAEGDFLKGPFGGRTTYLSYETYPNEGVVRVRGWSTLTTPDSGVNGSGTLATLTFRIKTKGVCNIDLGAVLYDPISMPMFASSIEGATFRTLQGDTDNNGVVNDLDLVTVRYAYGSKHGDVNWNRSADVNSDNLIDVFDSYHIGIDYGRSI